MEGDDDNIVKFGPRPKPIRQVLRMPGSSQCLHVVTLLDHRRRCLVCQGCGVIVDAYDYLSKVVERGEGYEKWFDEQKRKADAEQKRAKALRREAEKLERQIESLRRNMATLERQCRMDFGIAESEIAKMKAMLKK